MDTGSIITLVVIFIIIFYVVGIYNRLVALKNRFKNAYAQIDVQLTRRYDLIPNLVETAKGYMAHEKETLEAVIQARNQAVSANQTAAKNPDDSGAIQGIVGAEAMLTGTLGKFFALSESYPDLKANETMNNVMEELSTTENKVAFSRQAYNDSVMTYNTYKEQFPNSIISNQFNFKDAELFVVDEPEVKKAVKVSFS
ncbi:MAG: LemA family protein [Gammaproteobacteria bacterium]|nr:LemA family protein [Gammaproteobacteria bacterium]